MGNKDLIEITWIRLREGLSSDPNAANEGKGLLLRFDQRLSQLLISLLGLPKRRWSGRVLDSRRWLTALGAEGERWDLE